MARATPGPIASQVFGSIGGTSFARWRGGMRISTRTSRPERQTINQAPIRQAIAQGSHAWANLTDAQRATWQSLAVAPLTGFQTWMRAWIVQSNGGTIAAPPTPSIAPPPPLTAGQYSTWNGDLYIDALSRPIAPPEFIIFRAGSAVPSRNRATQRQIAQYQSIAPTGLDTTPDRAIQKLDSSSGLTATGTLTTATEWTISVWAYTVAPGAAIGERLWVFSSSSAGLFRRDPTYIAMQAPGFIVYLTAQTPIPNTWELFTVTSSTIANSTLIYHNGALIPGTAIPFISIATTGFNLGAIIGGGSWIDAALADCFIDNTVFTPTQIANLWNNGIGRPYTLTASTAAYWPLRTISGGQSPDLAPGNHPLTVTACTLYRGPWTRLIYPASATPFPSPRKTLIRAQTLTSTGLAGDTTLDTIEW